VSRLLRGLFTDWEIKTESLGYRSIAGRSFELSATWQGEIVLRLPAILSLISQADTLLTLDMNQKYGPAVQGDFNGDGIVDVLLRNIDTGHFDVWLGKEGDPDRASLTQPAPKEVSERIRNLLFTTSDNVWDIDRIKKALNALINRHLFTVTGGEDPDLHLPQFAGREATEVSVTDIDHDKTDELLFRYRAPQADRLTIFELYTLAPQ
jgi:hypothetical protein